MTNERKNDVVGHQTFINYQLDVEPNFVCLKVILTPSSGTDTRSYREMRPKISEGNDD